MEERTRMLREHRRDAVRYARDLLGRHTFILDTETTGLGDDAEVCEIAVFDLRGEVMLHERVQPLYGIPEEASRIHGISNVDVRSAPRINDETFELDLSLVLSLPSVLATYNADFDFRILRQSAAAVGAFDLLDEVMMAYAKKACLMNLYAQFYGEWSEYHGSYTWQSLEAAARQCGLEWEGEAHSALGDARMALAVLRHMASDY